jgi:hypothetical protein
MRLALVLAAILATATQPSTGWRVLSTHATYGQIAIAATRASSKHPTGIAARVTARHPQRVAAHGVLAVSPRGFTRGTTLEPAATYVAKAPVKVWCANSPRSWHAFMIRTYGSDNGSNGSAIPGVDEVFLPPKVCYPLELSATGLKFLPDELAPPIELLTHEAIHARGESNQGTTDCDAVHEMPGVAVRFFHVSPGEQLRDLMAEAWAWRDKSASMYRTVC